MDRMIDPPLARPIVPPTQPADIWDSARKEMLLDAEVTNLNTGSFGPTPRVVFEHVTELRRRLASEPMDFLVRQAPDLLWDARQRLATFLGGRPERLLFTVNVSAAINLVASSLCLAAPGEILLTDHEYGAMHWCWERAAKRLGLTLRACSLPKHPAAPGEIVEAMSQALTDRTRLLFFSHVLSPTGMVLPARELCAEAQRRGVITVIDGAHAPAMIPLNIEALGCDFYGGNCHKWLLAPIGTGFLYASAGSIDRLSPLQVSWGWHHSYRDLDCRDEFGSTPRLRALEFEGTRDPCAWLSVPAAIDFQGRLGWEAIRRRMRQLGAFARARMHTVAGLEPATPEHPELHGAMTAFQLPADVIPQVLRDGLWKKARIEMPVIERADRNLIRVSMHFYNTEEEIERLIGWLPSLLDAARSR